MRHMHTDQNCLQWLHNFHDVEGQIAGWIEQLANFQYEIAHRSGKLHANTDAMSRFMEEGQVAENSGRVGMQPLSNPVICVARAGGQAIGSIQRTEEDEISVAQAEDDEIQRWLF